MTPEPHLRRTRGMGAIGMWVVLISAAVAGQSAETKNAALARAIDQERGLDAGALVALALDRSADIAVANAMVAGATGRERQAALRSNPEATVERRDQVGGMDATTAVGVNWALEWGRIQPRRDVAAADRHVAEWDRQETRRQLALRIRAAYGEVLAAARLLEVTEAQIETTSNVLSLATARASSGSGAALERDQAAIEVSLLTRQRYRAELRLDTSRLALAELVGLGPSDPLRIRGALDRAAEDEATTVVDEPSTGPDAGRSDLRASAARLAAAEARTRSAQADGRLDIGVFGQYMSMTSGFPQRGFSESGAIVPITGRFHTLVGGVSFMLPWLNRQQGAVSAATAETTAAARQLDRNRLAADHQVALGRLRAQSARAATTLLRDDTLPRARANVDVLREAYALGARTLAEVLAEVRRVQQIEIEYTDALLEWYQASVELRAALGRAS
jgi:outer membrane protein, heavy metal efflux system